MRDSCIVHGGGPCDCYHTEPFERGDHQWKLSKATSYCIKNKLFTKTRVVKLPPCDGFELGYMAIHIHTNGSMTYDRVDEIEDVDDARCSSEKMG